MFKIKSFDDILYPITQKQFFAEYYNKKHLHIRAKENRFADVMNWDVLNDILNMQDVWSSQSLELVLDKNRIEPARYCNTAINRDHISLQIPDADKVTAFLEAGASLVANAIDTLTPNLRKISHIFENTLCAKSQANLYCSWKQRQAFASHFDTHDVFAIHFEGEKVWQIYEGRCETPINHVSFKSLSREVHDEQKGKLLEEVELRPGDLLYIPRGLYHDALAASSGVIHIAFGMTSSIGVDLFNMLHGAMLQKPQIRANLPLPHEGDQALKDYVANIQRELIGISSSDEFLAQVKALRDNFAFKRQEFHLPVSPDNAKYKVMEGLSVLIDAKENPPKAVLKTPKGNLPIPPQFAEIMDFVVKKGAFSVKELYQQAQNLQEADVDKFISDIRNMKIISPDIPS